MMFTSNQEMMREEEATAQAQATAMAEARDGAIEASGKNRIADYLQTCWIKAKDAKEQGVEPRILENMRQIDGEYEADKLTAIKQVGGSEVFMMITDAKVKNAGFWVDDILFRPSQLPFGISPTPIPDLPEEIKAEIYSMLMAEVATQLAEEATMMGVELTPEMVQGHVMEVLPQVERKAIDLVISRAKEIAKHTERRVDDKLREGGWYKALKAASANIIMHTGIIKGPIMRMKNVTKLATDPATGKISRITERTPIPTWESRHPLYIYPSPDSTGVNDGYLIDRVKITPIALQDLIGVAGYDEGEIRAVLLEAKNGKLSEWLQVDQSIRDINEESSTFFYDSDKLDALEFYGYVNGAMLIEWGLSAEEDKEPISPDLYYDVCAMKIGSHVIKVALREGDKPFYVASFEPREGSFWGKGLPQVILDCQTVCNACARAIVNNAAIASGPQVERNIDRIPMTSREDKFLVPWKVWDVTESTMMATSPAMKFYQPPMVVDKLINIYNQFSKIADEHSGVPAFTHGDPNVGGGGNALADYEKILTVNGPVEIGSVPVGENLVNTYGSASTVTGVFPQGLSDIFRIKFSNNASVDCDMNHRWSVRTHHGRKFQTLTTEEILEKGLFRPSAMSWRNPSGWKPKWMLPIVDCVEFSERTVTIDPYTMGALLGDGDNRGRITAMDKEIFDRIPYELGVPDKTCRGKAQTRTVKGVRPLYRKYGLNCTSLLKFIPEDYLYNSKEVRMELLRGLMDTDGCCSKAGEVFFATSSRRLAEDFTLLVRSLGGITNGVTVRNGEAYRDFGKGNCFCQTGYGVTFNLSWERVFHLQRKHERTRETPRTHTYITGIEYIGKHPATCISVGSADKRYLCKNYIPTHNTSSGLSMLMGAAARGIKGLVKIIDDSMIAPSVQAQYEWLVSNEDMAGFICDYTIHASGSHSALAKEQLAARRMEFIQLTGNPLFAPIVGEEGFKYLLQETAEAISLDLTKVFQGAPVPVQQPVQQEGAPGGQGMGVPPPQGSRELDQAGRPVSGTDTRQFNEPSR